jgi:high affinity Mn2+ porin
MPPAAAFVLLFLVVARFGRAQEAPSAGKSPGPPDARANLHVQLTTVTQAHPSFDAPYSGPNSLNPDTEHETTITSTLFLGARLWKGAEIYVNPELSGGAGLGHTLGIAGFPNGEAFRVGDAQPRIYLGRVMLRQTLAAGVETESVEDDANQLGGERPVRRWTLTAGKFGVGDFFDGNAYSHDPRKQFLNWADWTAGAWDYSADTRGYTWGAVIEYDDVGWAARFGATAEPKVANGIEFDKDLRRAHAFTAELERRYGLDGQKGAARFILFVNRARMGNYREAIVEADGRPPDVTSDAPDRTKQMGVCRERRAGRGNRRRPLSPGKLERWVERSVGVRGDRSISDDRRRPQGAAQKPPRG